jgi:hypothetical protein
MCTIRKVLSTAVGAIAVTVALGVTPGVGSTLLATTNGDVHIGGLTDACPMPRPIGCDDPGLAADGTANPTAVNGDIHIGGNAAPAATTGDIHVGSGG